MKRTAPINAPNVLQGSSTTKSKRFVRVVQSGFSKMNWVNLHVKSVRWAKRTTSHVQRVVRFVLLVTQVKIALHALPGSILLIHPPARFVHPVGSNRTPRPRVAPSVRLDGPTFLHEQDVTRVLPVSTSTLPAPPGASSVDPPHGQTLIRQHVYSAPLGITAL